MTAVIWLGAVLAWAAASRYLFRRWVRDDTFAIGAADRCSHGYKHLHLGQSCHNMGEPAPHPAVAAFAVTAGLLLPVTLFAAFVMHNPPQGRRALEERTRALEAENKRLRREQEGSPLRTVADIEAKMNKRANSPCPCEGTIPIPGHTRSGHYR